jgi:hypothetical protein
MTEEKLVKNAKIAKIFSCEACDYICSNKYDYNKHLATQKHFLLTSDLSEKSIKKYPCVCGKEYKHNQSLYTHKKTCQTLIQNESTSKMMEILKQNNDLLMQNHDLKEIILEQKEVILEQKEERKEVTLLLKKVEQNGEEQLEHTKKVIEIAIEQKYLAIDQAEEQTEHNKKVLEIAEEQKELMEQIKEKSGHTIINNNTQNNTNNHFNLNNYLTVTCKDAMNIEDTKESLKQFVITNEQIAFFENGSHVQGMCNIIDAYFASIPIVERPVHCSDLKRETMHWKNKGGEWEKEDDSGLRSNEKTFMQCINGYTFNKTIKWKDEELDTNNNDKDDDKYNKVLTNMIGPLSNPTKQVIIKGKIRAHIAKKTMIGKVEVL